MFIEIISLFLIMGNGVIVGAINPKTDLMSPSETNYDFDFCTRELRGSPCLDSIMKAFCVERSSVPVKNGCCNMFHFTFSKQCVRILANEAKSKHICGKDDDLIDERADYLHQRCIVNIDLA